MAEPPKKRKRTVLTIDQKLEICELLNKKYSFSVISQKFDVGRSNVADIKKSEKKIIAIKERMEALNRRTAKCMKLGKYVELDEALYKWFVQVRKNGCLVS